MKKIIILISSFFLLIVSSQRIDAQTKEETVAQINNILQKSIGLYKDIDFAGESEVHIIEQIFSLESYTLRQRSKLMDGDFQWNDYNLYSTDIPWTTFKEIKIKDDLDSENLKEIMLLFGEKLKFFVKDNMKTPEKMEEAPMRYYIKLYVDADKVDELKNAFLELKKFVGQ